MATGLLTVTHTGSNSPTVIPLSGLPQTTLVGYREHPISYQYLDHFRQSQASATWINFSGDYRVYENDTVEFVGLLRAIQGITGVTGFKWDHGTRIPFYGWLGVSPTSGREVLLGYTSVSASPCPCTATFKLSAGEKFWGLGRHADREIVDPLVYPFMPFPTYPETAFFEVSTALDFDPSTANGVHFWVSRPTTDSLKIDWYHQYNGDVGLLYSAGMDVTAFNIDLNNYGGNTSGSTTKSLDTDDMYFYFQQATAGSNNPQYGANVGWFHNRGSLSGAAVDPHGKYAQPEALFWKRAASVAGGTPTDAQFDIANNLIVGLKNEGIFDKVVYFVPLLGNNLNSALIPLIDRYRYGPLLNSGFTNTDFTYLSGLKGNGSSKVITFPFRPNNLNINGSSGGVGYWELQQSSGTQTTTYALAMGADGSNIFGISIDDPSRRFRWGQSGNSAVESISGGNAFFHGERSSNISRSLYVDGTLRATNTTSDGGTNISTRPLQLMGRQEANVGGAQLYYAGRCGCAILTNGGLNGTEAQALHSILLNYLMIPSGRVSL